MLRSLGVGLLLVTACSITPRAALALDLAPVRSFAHKLTERIRAKTGQGGLLLQDLIHGRVRSSSPPSLHPRSLLPSGPDVSLMAWEGVTHHTVFTPFTYLGRGLIGAPRPGSGVPTIDFVIERASTQGVITAAGFVPTWIYVASLRAEVDGTPIWRGTTHHLSTEDHGDFLSTASNRMEARRQLEQMLVAAQQRKESLREQTNSEISTRQQRSKGRTTREFPAGYIADIPAARLPLAPHILLGSLAEGRQLMRQLAGGRSEALRAYGVEVPFGVSTIEWGLGEANGRFFVFPGLSRKVEWSDGVIPRGHTHPSDS